MADGSEKGQRGEDIEEMRDEDVLDHRICTDDIFELYIDEFLLSDGLNQRLNETVDVNIDYRLKSTKIDKLSPEIQHAWAILFLSKQIGRSFDGTRINTVQHTQIQRFTDDELLLIHDAFVLIKMHKKNQRLSFTNKELFFLNRIKGRIEPFLEERKQRKNEKKQRQEQLEEWRAQREAVKAAKKVGKPGTVESEEAVAPKEERDPGENDVANREDLTVEPRNASELGSNRPSTAELIAYFVECRKEKQPIHVQAQKEFLKLLKPRLIDDSALMDLEEEYWSAEILMDRALIFFNRFGIDAFDRMNMDVNYLHNAGLVLMDYNRCFTVDQQIWWPEIVIRYYTSLINNSTNFDDIQALNEADCLSFWNAFQTVNNRKSRDLNEEEIRYYEQLRSLYFNEKEKDVQKAPEDQGTVDSSDGIIIFNPEAFAKVDLAAYLREIRGGEPVEREESESDTIVELGTAELVIMPASGRLTGLVEEMSKTITIREEDMDDSLSDSGISAGSITYNSASGNLIFDARRLKKLRMLHNREFSESEFRDYSSLQELYNAGFLSNNESYLNSYWEYLYRRIVDLKIGNAMDQVHFSELKMIFTLKNFSPEKGDFWDDGQWDIFRLYVSDFRRQELDIRQSRIYGVLLRCLKSRYPEEWRQNPHYEEHLGCIDMLDKFPSNGFDWRRTDFDVKHFNTLREHYENQNLPRRVDRQIYLQMLRAIIKWSPDRIDDQLMWHLNALENSEGGGKLSNPKQLTGKTDEF